MTPRPCPCGPHTTTEHERRRRLARTGLAVMAVLLGSGMYLSEKHFGVAVLLVVLAYAFGVGAYVVHPTSYALDDEKSTNDEEWTAADERARRADHDRILNEAMRRRPSMRHRRQDGAA